jgi:hypothetical protein
MISKAQETKAKIDQRETKEFLYNKGNNQQSEDRFYKMRGNIWKLLIRPGSKFPEYIRNSNYSTAKINKQTKIPNNPITNGQKT